MNHFIWPVKNSMDSNDYSQPVRSTEPSSNSLKKWYFCLNERGLKREFRFIRAAVGSAFRNTNLVPHCIYDGEDCRELDALRRADVVILNHRSSLEAELRAAYGEKFDTFRGHWLRLDLPLLETDAEQILYTDIDVIFLRDPCRYVFTPNYAAVCEESRLGDRGHFNSGVMVMNLPALRAMHPSLLDSVRKRLACDFKYPPHDQKSLNDAMLDKVEWMVPEMNWKPYWGTNSHAIIAHFHGPKPWHVAAIRSGEAATMKPAFKVLHDRSPSGYDAFISEFNAASDWAVSLGL